jgi:hypothetical protein
MDWAFANYGKAGAVGQLVGPATAGQASASAGALAPVRPAVSVGSGAVSSASLLMWLAGVAGAGALALAGAAVRRSSRRRRQQLSPLGLAPIRRR